jgi:hypothetical protein
VTQRDQKIVLMLILGVVGVGVAIFIVKTWFLDPFLDYNQKIGSLESKVELVDGQIKSVLSGLKLMDEKRKISLPANQVTASAEYDRYLVTLFQKSGLSEVYVKGPPAADPKAAPAVPTAQTAPKKHGHTVLTYTVVAKGDLAGVVATLDGLQRTPVLHRVKGLQIGRQESSGKDPNSGKLRVEMTLETMIVAGVKPGYEPTLKADAKLKLPTEYNPRRYQDIARKNIFIGLTPQPTGPDPTAITEEEELIPEHVRLVSTEPTSSEAYLRNLIFRVRETRVRTERGFDTFRIMNEDGTKELLRAKVLRIDQRDMYFQVKERVYGIHIGQTVADAMRHSLSEAELKEKGLTGLIQAYDPKTNATTEAAPAKEGKTGKKRS